MVWEGSGRDLGGSWGGSWGGLGGVWEGSGRDLGGSWEGSGDGSGGVEEGPRTEDPRVRGSEDRGSGIPGSESPRIWSKVRIPENPEADRLLWQVSIAGAYDPGRRTPEASVIPRIDHFIDDFWPL